MTILSLIWWTTILNCKCLSSSCYNLSWLLPIKYLPILYFFCLFLKESNYPIFFPSLNFSLKQFLSIFLFARAPSKICKTEKLLNIPQCHFLIISQIKKSWFLLARALSLEYLHFSCKRRKDLHSPSSKPFSHFLESCISRYL